MVISSVQFSQVPVLASAGRPNQSPASFLLRLSAEDRMNCLDRFDCTTFADQIRLGMHETRPDDPNRKNIERELLKIQRAPGKDKRYQLLSFFVTSEIDREALPQKSIQYFFDAMQTGRRSLHIARSASSTGEEYPFEAMVHEIKPPLERLSRMRIAREFSEMRKMHGIFLLTGLFAFPFGLYEAGRGLFILFVYLELWQQSHDPAIPELMIPWAKQVGWGFAASSVFPLLLYSPLVGRSGHLRLVDYINHHAKFGDPEAKRLLTELKTRGDAVGAAARLYLENLTTK